MFHFRWGSPLRCQKAMNFKFFCPHCGQRIEVSQEHVGTRGVCPVCSMDFIVPDPPVSPIPQTSAPENNSPIRNYNSKALAYFRSCLPINSHPPNRRAPSKPDIQYAQRLLCNAGLSFFYIPIVVPSVVGNRFEILPYMICTHRINAHLSPASLFLIEEKSK